MNIFYKKKFHFFILITSLLLLSSCGPILSSDQPMQAIEVTDANLEKCLQLQKEGQREEWGYLEDGWHQFDEIDPEKPVYKSMYRVLGSDVKTVVIEETSPSKDWYRIDSYCFNEQGVAIEIYSDLRTFYTDRGGVQYIRNWLYSDDGSLKSNTFELLSLSKKEKIETTNPNEIIFQDSPPSIVKDYIELMDQLKLE